MWFKKEKLSEREQSNIDVIQAMLARPECVIEIQPRDMSYILAIEEDNYYISIDSVGIEISVITDGVRSIISRQFEQKVLSLAIDIIYNETVKRRERRKEKIFQHELTVLSNLQKSLTLKIA